MKIVGAIFGFFALAAVFVVWIRIYKSIKGDDSPLFSWSKRDGPGKEDNALEEFIASYKRGAVATSGAPAAKPVSAKPSPAAAPAESAAPAKLESFISGPTKLTYLVCKAGLRDHHIFARVPLSALSGNGAAGAELARISIDLLICNAAMSAVAAVDLVDAASPATNPAKSDYLKALGIRYLRLSAKALPRPDELHALLYKM